MYYICPVCKEELAITPYYKTSHGKVCEDCFEGGDYEEKVMPIKRCSSGGKPGFKWGDKALVIPIRLEIKLLEKQLKQKLVNKVRL